VFSDSVFSKTAGFRLSVLGDGNIAIPRAGAAYRSPLFITPDPQPVSHTAED
jgi:hypothetical protein